MKWIYTIYAYETNTQYLYTLNEYKLSGWVKSDTWIFAAQFLTLVADMLLFLNDTVT